MPQKQTTQGQLNNNKTQNQTSYVLLDAMETRTIDSLGPAELELPSQQLSSVPSSVD